MNKAMDLRLQHLEAQKKAQQKPTKIDDDLESNTGLLIRSGSRQIQADAFAKAVGGRAY